MGSIKFPLAVVISGQDVGLEAALGKVNQRLRATGQLATSVGRGLTYGLTLPMAALGAAAIRTGTAVESNVLQLQAAGGLSKQQAQQLRELSRQYSELGVGARDATEGMVTFSKAGLTVTEIMAVMRPAIVLAKGEQLQFATAAEGLVGVISGYRKPFTDAGIVVDQLAHAAAATTVDVSDMFEALKLSGPIAAGVNQTFEDTVAILALMGQNMFKGTLGGTALRGTLNDLVNLTPQATARLAQLKIDPADLRTSTGELRSMVEIIELLEKRAATAEDMLALFGDRGGPAMAATLAMGSSKIRALSDELSRAEGTGLKKFEIGMSGAQGANDRLAASLQNLGDSVAQSGLLDAFASMVRTVDGWVKALDRLSPRTKETIVQTGAVVAAIGPLLFIVGKTISSVLTLSAAYKTLAAAQTLAGTTAAAATPKVAALGGAANTAGAGGMARLLGPAAFLALGGVGAGTSHKGPETSPQRVHALLEDLSRQARVDPHQGLKWYQDVGTFEVNRVRELLARGFADKGGVRERHAEILVKFENAPPGTRVSGSDDAGAGVKLDVGYAMATP